ncbi:pentatricopeptide repeat-containing protein At2g34400-like [Impatiens glandulifera]|uniref:pentatricopeptide repeat-containing protein At2g34400-like n=1 Tax=Impatiens glandulifera TaxID=253017 RepID=UPI001FB16111|nr:pentatricopeptide repeat-containing protein At2g34400-like [Impatiens glandulifera]
MGLQFLLKEVTNDHHHHLLLLLSSDDEAEGTNEATNEATVNVSFSRGQNLRRSLVLDGIDVTGYPIFNDAKVEKAIASVADECVSVADECSSVADAIFIYNHFLKSNSNISPDHHTYPALITACSRLPSLLSIGKQLHARIIITGFNNDIYVQNSLIHFYGFADEKNNARKVFDSMPQRDLTTWNCLIAAHSHDDALILLRKMKLNGIDVDSITLMNILNACGRERDQKGGEIVHGLGLKTGLGSDSKLRKSAMGMYVKCSDMISAEKLFDEMTIRTDVIIWNSLIHGYVQLNRPNDALKLFMRMENTIEKDETTVVSLLAASAALLNLNYGKQIHSFLLRKNINYDKFIETALIDMYSKCGNLEKALLIFKNSKSKDVYTWTTMIQGLANNGRGYESLNLLNEMENQGIKPNSATFVSALTGCGKSGLVEQGCEVFKKMVEIYGIKPRIEHFGCLIDLLIGCGKMEMAMEFIEMIDEEERIVVYKSFLNGCIDDCRIDLGLKFVDELCKFGLISDHDCDHDDAIFVMVSNFYALAGEWFRVGEIRKMMRSFDLVKEQGISSI